MLGRIREPVVHRRHREEHRLFMTRIDERLRDTLGREAGEIVKRATDAQAAKKPQHQAVGMNQR